MGDFGKKIPNKQVPEMSVPQKNEKNLSQLSDKKQDVSMKRSNIYFNSSQLFIGIHIII